MDFLYFSLRYDGMEMVQVTPLFENFSILNPNALAAVIKGMWTVKLCSNKILQLLTRVPANVGCLV